MLHVQENVDIPLIQQIILLNVFNAYKVANECNSKENIYIKKCYILSEIINAEEVQCATTTAYKVLVYGTTF